MPSLDADALVQAVPALAQVAGLRARTVNTRPSVQLTAAEALDIARAAAGRGRLRPRRRGDPRHRHARGGRAAVRPRSTPARRRSSSRARCATPRRSGPTARRTCSTPSWWPARRAPRASACSSPSPARSTPRAPSARPTRPRPDAFASPRLGPIGRVQEGRAWMARRVERFPPVPVASLDATVHIVPAALGADGTLVDAALEAGADGLVGVVLGAGHTPPPFLAGAQARRRARAGRRHRAARARVDPARHVRLRGRRARPARRAR